MEPAHHGRRLIDVSELQAAFDSRIIIEPPPRRDPDHQNKYDVRRLPWSQPPNRRVTFSPELVLEETDAVQENEESAENSEPPQYEIEKIINTRTRRGKAEVLVKWVGYPWTMCSWIPLSNVPSGERDFALHEFRRRLVIAARIKSLIFDEHKKRAQFMARKQIHLDPRIVEDVFHRYQHPYVPLYGNPEANLLFQRRCMKWETEMNLINLSKGIAPLYVENWVDDEAAPDDFFFCTEYIYHTSAEGIVQSNMSNKRCDKQRHCCKNFLNKQRYLHPNFFEHHLYECTPRCECGPKCRNRVTQKGRQVPLVLFRTVERGWSVRAAVDMPRGTFVSEYFGEIISPEEAKNREISSYMFDIHFVIVLEGEKKKPKKRRRRGKKKGKGRKKGKDGNAEMDKKNEAEPQEESQEILEKQAAEEDMDVQIIEEGNQPTREGSCDCLKEIDDPEIAKPFDVNPLVANNTTDPLQMEMSEDSKSTVSTIIDVVTVSDDQNNEKTSPQGLVAYSISSDSANEKDEEPRIDDKVDENCGFEPELVEDDQMDVDKEKDEETAEGHINSSMNSTADSGVPDLVIDAKTFGNEARFFNNSCDPNMMAFRVYSNPYDSRIFRICFFTTKDVRRGEELTFNYYVGKLDNLNNSQWTLNCLCMHTDCVGRIG
ncbi:unnamed protein product [Bursaphelenchus xylophilus]|uniref:(pine wood nematode) hypothetical protein n=1 Tax=Bursaphelenchus xylophilus TaxID=6326 RepID=A0A1I7S0F5_BURXY|nr:unnamed protein product [Bursaphelenchus xylophilus]CAG9132237.1 unnamed protein product [Bursaphelenchus xylophilus]